MVLSECRMAKPVWSKPTVAPLRVRALVDSIRECVWGTCNTSERIRSYPLFVLMCCMSPKHTRVYCPQAPLLSRELQLVSTTLALPFGIQREPLWMDTRMEAFIGLWGTKY